MLGWLGCIATLSHSRLDGTRFRESQPRQLETRYFCVEDATLCNTSVPDGSIRNNGCRLEEQTFLNSGLQPRLAEKIAPPQNTVPASHIIFFKIGVISRVF